MKTRFARIFPAIVLMFSLLAGCAQVSEIADNVAQAAKDELLQQIETKLEEHKVDIVEIKTAMGHLNGDDSKAVQFFAAILIRTNSDTAPETCAEALKGMFTHTGYMTQEQSAVIHELLEHKQLSYDRSDFSDGTYYTVYAYSKSLLPDLTGKK